MQPPPEPTPTTTRVPTPTLTPRQRLLGQTLVGAQFILIAVLGVLAAASLRHGSAPVGAWGLLAAGIAIGVWAVTANRPGNFNIRPEPRLGARLIEQGPYRWIRHPMYTAVLAYGAACAWAHGSAAAWLAGALLAGVLVLKALLEERLMIAVHPGYAAYCLRTRRFLPGLV